MRPDRLATPLLFTAVLLAATPEPGSAGSFLFAEDNGANIITHPAGYAGNGGTITVSVCINPASANAAAMVVPVQNIVATWNARAVASPNLVFGAGNDIGSSQYDFESVALHELGHCIGLAHPNLSSESGLSGSDQNYTKATRGPDGAYDLGIGGDGVRGSADDARGDDENLHWFRRSDDDPFIPSSTADRTTYARALDALPAGHSFAANADRAVGAALGFPNTEAVMQQGTYNDEDQRRLSADDVATLALGMSGLDMTAGTGDDYMLVLTYGGLSSSCNVVLDFDDTRTSFAACYTSGAFLNGTHVRITSANIAFATGIAWFFNSVPSSPTTTTTVASSTTSSSAPASTTTSTLPVDLCEDAVRTTCIAATRGRLRIDERTRRLAILMKGLTASLGAADFGDPVAGDTSYTVCIYDEQGMEVGGLTLAREGATCGPRRRPCWRALGSLGFRYTDRAGTVHGIRRILLKGGPAGAGKAVLRAKVVPGRSVSEFPRGMPRALTTSRLATVQLIGSDGPCLSLTTDQVLAAHAARFSARRRR